MKTLVLILFIGIVYPVFSQDTTELIIYQDGAKSFRLISDKDTTFICTYPNGKKESVCQLKQNEITGTYFRWYENGKLMWQKEMKNAVQHGKSVYFNEKGINVAELLFENGKIKDTVFIKENTHLLFGKITCKSIVYGGVQNEDGSSNISEYSGPYMNFRMYAATVDSLKKPELISSFKSDFNGDFIITVPAGIISFFPQNIKIDSLEPGQYEIPGSNWKSGHSGWTKQGPLEVKQKDLLLFIELHHETVGYAP